MHAHVQAAYTYKVYTHDYKLYTIHVFVAFSLSGEATFVRPSPQPILPLNCAGPRRSFYKDIDGSLFGKPSALVGQGQRTFPYDQSSMVMPGPCTYSPVYNGYLCVQNATQVGR